MTGIQKHLMHITKQNAHIKAKKAFLEISV
jgi:hypothetical protein